MSDTLPELWDVFHVWMEATHPAKYKFFVCLVQTHQSFVGVVINSRINELGQGEYLRPCYAPLDTELHPFLAHDSYADCTRTFTLGVAVLTDFRGRLHPEATARVLESVSACPRLKGKTKKALLALR